MSSKHTFPGLDRFLAYDHGAAQQERIKRVGGNFPLANATLPIRIYEPREAYMVERNLKGEIWPSSHRAAFQLDGYDDILLHINDEEQPWGIHKGLIHLIRDRKLVPCISLDENKRIIPNRRGNLNLLFLDIEIANSPETENIKNFYKTKYRESLHSHLEPFPIQVNNS